MYIFLEFFIKLIMFAITFYYLLEYILTCKVNTQLGLWIAFIFCIIIIIFFRCYSFHNITKCETCHQTIVKSILPAQIQSITN